MVVKFKGASKKSLELAVIVLFLLAISCNSQPAKPQIDFTILQSGQSQTSEKSGSQSQPDPKNRISYSVLPSNAEETVSGIYLVLVSPNSSKENLKWVVWDMVSKYNSPWLNIIFFKDKGAYRTYMNNIDNGVWAEFKTVIPDELLAKLKSDEYNKLQPCQYEYFFYFNGQDFNGNYCNFYN